MKLRDVFSLDALIVWLDQRETMFNGMYTGESGQPAFGYGMEPSGHTQASYGQEQDPYSVSYYQAAAAQYQRSIGWEQDQNGSSASTWNNQQKTTVTQAQSPTANYYGQPTTQQEPTSATQAESFDATATGTTMEKPMTGKMSFSRADLILKFRKT